MSKAAEASRTPPAATDDRPTLIELGVFVVLLAVLCVRPLISESFTQPAFSFLPEAEGGTTPATTIVLDLILLLGGLVAILFGRAGRVRLLLPALGCGLLGIAVVVSTAVAGDKRLAANAGSNLVIMAFAGLALVRLLRTRWMVMTLLAALLASGAVSAGKCITQWAYENNDTLEYWQEHAAERAARGIDPNSPAVVNYERRLKSAETPGFLSHPNVAANCLSMSALVALGVLVGLLREKRLQSPERIAGGVIAAALAGVMVFGLLLTHSTGGLGTLLIGAALLAVLAWWTNWADRHSRLVFAACAAAYVLVILAIAGHGLYHGTLPLTSLAFRWEYWQAAVHAIGDAPLTGLGRENFRDAYLLYKSAAATEEVSNAHNIWLILLSELGPLGLLAGVTLLTSAARGTMQSVAGEPQCEDTAPPPLLAVFVMIAFVAAHAIFSGTPLLEPGVGIIWFVQVIAFWCFAFWLVRGVLEHLSASGALTAVRYALFAALAASLIQNLIGFSLVTPAGLSLFVLCAAAGTAIPVLSGPAAAKATSRWQRPAAIGGSVLLAAAFVFAVALPSLRANAALQRSQLALATATTANDLERAYQLAQDAIEVDPWSVASAQHATRLARMVALQTGIPADVSATWLARAEESCRAGLARKPGSASLQRMLAETLSDIAARNPNVESARAAAEAWTRATKLYPTNPRAHLDAGQAWFDLWKQTPEATAGEQASAHFRQAIEIDATRIPEVAVKLRGRELQEIQACCDELAKAGFDVPTVPPPPHR